MLFWTPDFESWETRALTVRDWFGGWLLPRNAFNVSLSDITSSTITVQAALNPIISASRLLMADEVELMESGMFFDFESRDRAIHGAHTHPTNLTIPRNKIVSSLLKSSTMGDEGDGDKGWFIPPATLFPTYDEVRNTSQLCPPQHVAVTRITRILTSIRRDMILKRRNTSTMIFRWNRVL